MRDYSAVARNPQVHHVSNSGAGSGTSLDSPKVANGRQKSLFFSSHRTQMSVMPWGEAEDIRSSMRGKKAEQTVTALQRNTRIGGSGARIGRKAGARQRGSELSVHAGRC